MVPDDELMHQAAPWPAELAELVDRLAYREREGWRVSLAHIDRGQGSIGLTLVVLRVGPDSYHPDTILRVNHFFPVPPAAYDARSWRRWLFDRLGDVDTHERCENFKFHRDHGDLFDRPYAPSHGPGSDPYLVREIGTDLDRRTSFRGEVNPE